MTTNTTTAPTAAKPEDPDYLLAHAFNNRDVDAVRALFEDGAISRSTPELGSEALNGPDIVVGLIGAAAGSDQRMNISVVQVTQVGDLALSLSQWSVTGSTADGTPLSITHRGVEVTRRQADGTWKFVIDVAGAADGAMELTSIPPLPSYDS